MIRVPTRRHVGALALLLLLSRAIAPELGHTCAMESAGPAAVDAAAVHGIASTPARHTGHGSSDAHTGHRGDVVPHHDHGAPFDAMASAPHAEHSTPSEAPEEPPTCTCGAWCCCVPSVVVAPIPTELEVAVVAVLAAPLTARVDVAPQAHRDLRLPFANAPPRA